MIIPRKPALSRPPTPPAQQLPRSLCTWPMALCKVCASEANWNGTTHCLPRPLSPDKEAWCSGGLGESGAQESVSLLSSCYSFNISYFLKFHDLIPFYSQYGMLLSVPYNSGSFSLSWACPSSLLPCGLACNHCFPPELGGERDSQSTPCRVATLQQVQRGHLQTGFLPPGKPLRFLAHWCRGRKYVVI